MKLFNSKKFKEVSEEYMVAHRADLRPTSYANYLHLLKQRIIPEVGEIKVSKFSNDDLQRFVDKTIAAGYCKHGARDCVSIIKLVLKYAAKMGYCRLPVMDVRYPREVKKKNNHFLQDADYKKLLTYCMENPGKKTFPILISMTTGLRIGEVCALQYGDINFEKLTINVERSVKRVCTPGEKSVLEISDPKTLSSIREVPILPEVASLLKENRLANDVYISSGNNQKPLEPRSYRTKYTRIFDKLGIEHHTFHDLRHTFASRCINAGSDARTVADILGHTNVEMTLNTYTHSTDERRRTVAANAIAFT